MNSKKTCDGVDILKQLETMVVRRLLDDLDLSNPDDMKVIQDCVKLYEDIKRVLSAIDSK